MRALTVRPPWSWAITYGGKTVENRSWTSQHRGELAIHAGKNWDPAGEHSPLVRQAWLAAGHALGDLNARNPVFSLGAVVAVPDLVDICTVRDVRTDCGCCPWAWRGACHWQMENVRPLAEPVPCRGSLGLWPLHPEVTGRVRAQLAGQGADL